MSLVRVVLVNVTEDVGSESRHQGHKGRDCISKVASIQAVGAT